MTLQLRLTLLSLLLTAGAVTVLAAGAYVVARDRVYGSVDSGLAAKADAIGASIPVPEPALTADEIAASQRSLDAQVALGADLRVLDLGGETLYASPTGWDEAEEEALNAPGYQTVDQVDGRSRLLQRPILVAGQPVGYVEVRTSLAQADQSLAEVRRVLIIGALAVSAVAAMLAFVITGQAVQPVKDLAKLAGEVERTADFTKRLPENPSSQEMRAMAQTFNRMIARVERLVAAQRTFLSDTSHELRRPLTVLRTDLDVLNDPALGEPDRQAVVCEMQEVAKGMSDLLSELLLLSRQDEGLVRLEPTDFSELCAQRVKSVAQVYAQHTYECDIDPGVWVEADAEGLTRAVDNLLQNSALYTPGSGRVEVSLRVREGQAVLVVADNGPGMSSAEVEHAFERFYRGPGSRRLRPDGLGLGLAIVRQSADRHAGSVAIESVPGRGTRVTLAVPLFSG